MDAPLPRTLAEGAGLHARWTINPSGKGHATRGCRQPNIGESFPSLRVRSLDAPGISGVQFERYADDAICHCRSEVQAQELRLALEIRLAECRLRLHPDKTKIVYCKDANRKGTFTERAFDFLGYTFRSRLAINHRGEHFVSFIPAVSKKAAVKMRRRVRAWRLHWRSDLGLDAIVEWVCPVLRGWVNYYGRFYPSQLRDELRTIDEFLVRWLHRKYKRFRGHTMKKWDWLRSLKRRRPDLFAHWTLKPMAG